MTIVNQAVRRPTLEELAVAVSSLISADGPWGAAVIYDDNGELSKFIVHHQFIQDIPNNGIKLDGLDCWHLENLGEGWRQPYPDHWSPQRCAFRQRAEFQLAQAVLNLELELRPREAQAIVAAVDAEDDDEVRQMVRHMIANQAQYKEARRQRQMMAAAYGQ